MKVPVRLLAVFVLMLAAPAASMAHAGFEVVSYVLGIGSLSLDVGEEGSVDLEATNIDGAIGAWTIDIAYERDIVAAVDCAPRENSICDLERADNVVRVTGASAAGLVADTILATITFRCHGVGSSPLSLSSETGGIPELIFEVQTENGVITCQEGAEPTVTERATPTATPLPQLPATGSGAAPLGKAPNWSIAAIGGLGLAIAASFAMLLLLRHRP